MVGALLGAFVELDGTAVAFPQEGESLRDALRRVRPAVVFCDLDCIDETAMGPAVMLGARVIVFASDARRRDLSDTARRLEVDCMVLPDDLEGVIRMLREERQ